MSSYRTGSETNTTLTGNTMQSEIMGVHLHQHLTRTQFQKLINMKLNSQCCHDIKCKLEKEQMQKAIDWIAETLNDLIAKSEKQHREMTAIYNIHSKICAEFSLPVNVPKPTAWEQSKYNHASLKIRDYLLNKDAKTNIEANDLATKLKIPSSTNTFTKTANGLKTVDHMPQQSEPSVISSYQEPKQTDYLNTKMMNRKRKSPIRNNFQSLEANSTMAATAFMSSQQGIDSAFYSSTPATSTSIKFCGNHHTLDNHLIRTNERVKMPAAQLKTTATADHRVSLPVPSQVPISNHNPSPPTASALIIQGREIVLEFTPRIAEKKRKILPSPHTPIHNMLQKNIEVIEID